MLSDGGSTFLYGVTRIAQADPGSRAYFLKDALNSARQLVDDAGRVGLGRVYEPYGDPLSIAGEMRTAYGFAGEWRDATGLVNLRARYYQPQVGRFFQSDPWEGEKTNPPTQSRYPYALNNPILLTDPSGRVCIGGYSIGSGERCSAAYQDQVKGAIDKWAGLMGNPEFLRGFAYEFLEVLIVVGPDTQRAVFNHMLEESPILNAALEGTALYLAARCGDKSLIPALNYISNGVPGSRYWYEGRALGRMIAITMGLAAMGAGGLGAAAGISFSIFAGPAAALGLSETAAAGAVAFGGALVVGSAVVRELDDHLILMAVKGEIGEGGTHGAVFGSRGTQFTSKTFWTSKEGKVRLDAENPNPGQRPGNIHIQDKTTGGKYYYDPSTGEFGDLPSDIQRTISKDSTFQRALEQALRNLGER